MRSEVIVNRSHSRALLMFCGWGTDASVATMLNFSGYDTIAIWDYRTVSDFDTSLLLRYDEIVVAAWSFGVAAAARFLADNPALSVTRRVAINGTLHPVSDTLGIPEAISAAHSTDSQSARFLSFTDACQTAVHSPFQVVQ